MEESLLIRTSQRINRGDNVRRVGPDNFGDFRNHSVSTGLIVCVGKAKIDGRYESVAANAGNVCTREIITAFFFILNLTLIIQRGKRGKTGKRRTREGREGRRGALTFRYRR